MDDVVGRDPVRGHHQKPTVGGLVHLPDLAPGDQAIRLGYGDLGHDSRLASGAAPPAPATPPYWRVVEDGPSLFSVARNPDAGSRLAFLVRLPIEGGVVLKAKEPWSVSARVYCFLARAWVELGTGG